MRDTTDTGGWFSLDLPPLTCNPASVTLAVARAHGRTGAPPERRRWQRPDYAGRDTENVPGAAPLRIMEVSSVRAAGSADSLSAASTSSATGSVGADARVDHGSFDLRRFGDAHTR